VFKQPDYHEIMGLHDLSGPHPNVDLPDVWLAQVVDEESGIFVTRILARRRLSVESFMEDLSQQSGAFLKQP
jgi:hypothetical protein